MKPISTSLTPKAYTYFPVEILPRRCVASLLLQQWKGGDIWTNSAPHLPYQLSTPGGHTHTSRTQWQQEARQRHSEVVYSQHPGTVSTLLPKHSTLGPVPPTTFIINLELASGPWVCTWDKEISRWALFGFSSCSKDSKLPFRILSSFTSLEGASPNPNTLLTSIKG